MLFRSDEALQKQFDAATTGATKAMRELSSWMESNRSQSTHEFALGPDKFARMVADTEMVDTPLDQLEKIGQADLKRNRDALVKACTEYAPGQSVPDCMKKMNDDKPVEGTIAAARKQLPMLREFIIDKDLVSIPGTEQAQVEEYPPYNRANSAYIDIPGPYEKGLPSVYYFSTPDPS